MGAPKQKWTAEEEAALKAGVQKHGAGKWQTILRDPEFSGVLRSRSNVDLKDKWRNINVTLSGLGSREKARLALKRNPQLPKVEDKVTAVANGCSHENVAEAKPVVPSDTVQVADSKKTYTRLDTLILEAIAALREPKGSDRDAIAMHIEEEYCTPANFIKLLCSKLKFLTANGQLIKVKQRYRIPKHLPSPRTRSSSGSDPKIEESSAQRKEFKIFTKALVNTDLKTMEGMSADEAAATAAQFVAEAEAAVAEAEKAAMEAEAADAEAEAAEVFYEAAMKALRCQQLRAC